MPKWNCKGVFVELPVVNCLYVVTTSVDLTALLISIANSQKYGLHTGQHRASKVKSKCFISEFQMCASPSVGQLTLESFRKEDFGKHTSLLLLTKFLFVNPWQFVN